MRGSGQGLPAAERGLPAASPAVLPRRGEGSEKPRAGLGRELPVRGPDLVVSPYRKPKTKRAKRFLEKREPKLTENTKNAMLIKGGNANLTVTEVLKDIVSCWVCACGISLYRLSHYTDVPSLCFSLQFTCCMLQYQYFLALLFSTSQIVTSTPEMSLPPHQMMFSFFFYFLSLWQKLSAYSLPYYFSV